MANLGATNYRLGDPIPAFRTFDDAIAKAIPAIMPPARMTVSTAAERRMIEAGGFWTKWRNDVVPYMVEPQNVITSRRYGGLIFVGPARSAKTEGIVLNPVAHSIIAAPRRVHVVHMSRDEARDFSVGTVEPMIRNSEELAARMSTGRGADNLFDKRYSGGGRLTIGWPVVKQLSGKAIPLVIITDYDRIPDDIEGEGSVFALGRKRNTQHGSRGMTAAESSPGRPILDESWTPSTPHEAPPTTGILALYNPGTRGRWYWRCRDCGGKFEPSLERLVIPDEGSPGERGNATYLPCLHCGAVYEHTHKLEMNTAAEWLHESKSGELVPLEDCDRETDTASYWLQGPAAAFAPWSKIVARKCEAEETFERTGDESTLKAVINTDFGLPYLPRAIGLSAALSEKGLRDSATDHEWQKAPRGTRFITVAVDVQNGYFPVQVEAWNEHLERVVIDRFDIHTPPEGAPRAADRRIAPDRFAEDWDVLYGLVDLEYEVLTEDRALHPVAVIIDSRGLPGVTPNAYSFFRKARRSHPRRFWIVQGVGRADAKRAELARPETAQRGKRHVAKDIQIVKAAGNRLKDEVAASLLREDEGARALHIPRGAPSEIFAEFSGERRTEKGWEKKPGVKRNEALDLSVYSLALVIAVLMAEAIKDWAKPPAWASPDPTRNPFTVSNTHDKSKQTPVADPARTKTKARTTRGRRRRFDGW